MNFDQSRLVIETVQANSKKLDALMEKAGVTLPDPVEESAPAPAAETPPAPTAEASPEADAEA